LRDALGPDLVSRTTDEGPDVLRELTELPKDVETYRGALPRDFVQGHLTRIEAASGESV
jgi:hypothetical protein